MINTLITRINEHGAPGWHYYILLMRETNHTSVGYSRPGRVGDLPPGHIGMSEDVCRNVPFSVIALFG